MGVKTLLCVGNFDRSTGYAWNTIRHVWDEVANELSSYNVRSFVVYRNSSNKPDVKPDNSLQEIQSGWSSWQDLVNLCLQYNVDACWLTDQEVLTRDYGKLRAAGVTFVVMHVRTAESTDMPGPLRKLAKSFLAKKSSWTADKYIAISDYVRLRLINAGCLPSKKVTRIYNAIDVPSWLGDVDRAAIFSELGIAKNSRLIVTTCRAMSYKGVGTLIKAISLLPIRDAQGEKIITAYCGDGADLQLFRNLANELELNDRFLFLGARDNTRALVGAADLVVVPSTWQEAFGLSVVEAMASGKPVIGTRVGAIPELIDDKKTGILVEPGDAAALCSAIIKLLDDNEQSRELAINARNKAEELFNLPRLRAELSELFLKGLGLS